MERHREAITADVPVEAFRLAPFPYLVLSLRGVIVHANEAAACMLCAPPNRLVGWPLYWFVSSDDRRAYLDFLHQCLHAPRASQTLKLRTDAATFSVSLRATRVQVERHEDVLLTAVEDLRSCAKPKKQSLPHRPSSSSAWQLATRSWPRQTPLYAPRLKSAAASSSSCVTRWKR